MPIPAVLAAAMPAIISGAASLAGAGISAGTTIAATNARNEAQKRESELAYWRQRQEVARQNVYNSTSAQMARMASAGLNPNLMYQQAEQGLQSDIPRYEPAQIDSPFEKVGSIGAEMVSHLIGMKDIQNKSALAESQIALNTSTANFNVAQLHLTKIQGKRMISLLGWEISEKAQNIKLSEAQEKEFFAKIDKIQDERNLLVAQKGLTEAEAAKCSAEEATYLALLPSREEFGRMEVEEKRKAVELAAAQVKYYNTKRKVDIANSIANGIIGAAGVAAKFLGNGAPLSEVFGTNPWEMMSKQNKSGHVPSSGMELPGYYGLGEDSWLAGD